MKNEPVEPLKRLETWSPDVGDASFPFSARLARDNQWTPVFAQSVIREYRRFAFLAVAAGHPVTPSGQVEHPINRSPKRNLPVIISAFARVHSETNSTSSVAGSIADLCEAI